MGTSLEARVQRLETTIGGASLCTDPKCTHMGLWQLHRRALGLSEQPVPPHPKDYGKGFSVAAALMELNRQPGETEIAYAERMDQLMATGDANTRAWNPAPEVIPCR